MGKSRALLRRQHQGLVHPYSGTLRGKSRRGKLSREIEAFNLNYGKFL
jgi:hypothetical protein